MKLFIAIVATCTVSAVFAQRPTYAGSRPIGKPELASRFKDTETESSTIGVVNRVGEDGTTQKLPVDARGDADLVNRLSQWPRENQPFWLLNSKHIEAARHPQPGQSGQGVQTSQSGQGFQTSQSGQGFQPSQSGQGFQSSQGQGFQSGQIDRDFQTGGQGFRTQSRGSFGGNRNEFIGEEEFGDDFGGFNFESRSSFDQYDPSVPSRPIRPEQPRSSFLGSRGR